MNSRFFAIQAAFLALGASALSAQNPPPQEPAPSGSVIRTETRVVLVEIVLVGVFTGIQLHSATQVHLRLAVSAFALQKQFVGS